MFCCRTYRRPGIGAVHTVWLCARDFMENDKCAYAMEGGGGKGAQQRSENILTMSNEYKFVIYYYSHEYRMEVTACRMPGREKCKHIVM